MKKIKLLIIEENRLLRDGITSMLKGQPDIKVITAAGGNEKSLEKIRQIMPDIILLNLGLRNQNSLTIVEVVKKDFPKARIIVMDLTPDQGDINLFFDAGASGFILKEATLDELLITVRAVADGGNVFPPDLTESLFSQIVERALKGSKAKLAKAVCMTKRELEVIGLIGDGLSNKEIGQNLFVSTFTVKSHIHNIMEKLVLHTRLEVANYSYSSRSMKKIVKNISFAN